MTPELASEALEVTTWPLLTPAPPDGLVIETLLGGVLSFVNVKATVPLFPDASVTAAVSTGALVVPLVYENELTEVALALAPVTLGASGAVCVQPVVVPVRTGNESEARPEVASATPTCSLNDPPPPTLPLY